MYCMCHSASFSKHSINSSISSGPAIFSCRFRYWSHVRGCASVFGGKYYLASWGFNLSHALNSHESFLSALYCNNRLFRSCLTAQAKHCPVTVLQNYMVLYFFTVTKKSFFSSISSPGSSSLFFFFKELLFFKYRCEMYGRRWGPLVKY